MRKLALWLVWHLLDAKTVEPVPARIVYLVGSERQDGSLTRHESAS